MKKNQRVVCLGGGIGTVNLIKGLKDHFEHIAAIVSMADDGGSGGRLRRLYNILPPGDVASCMAALMDNPNPQMSKLLTYRFPGDRYGKDEELYGHKLGNLMLAAATDMTGSFPNAIALLKELFRIKEDIIPATSKSVSITAKTTDGRVIQGEENIDLGKFHGDSPLDSISLVPTTIEASPESLTALKASDIVIVGPGDLYTTVLPCVIIPEIKEFLLQNKKHQIFIVNVANKPFESKGYSEADFVNAIKKHLGAFPFQTVIANDNFSLPLPNNLSIDYTYVQLANEKPEKYQLITEDVVDESFPLYHDHKKLASLVAKTV
ncbi:MAG: gluconeogenesis factor YvcK family protein [Candidatus Levyibacteriota bacterium]